MRALAAVTTTALALATLTACGGDASGEGSVDCADAPEVTVTDNGSSPRTELRLSPKQGDTVKLDLELDMDLSMEADGSSVPTGSVPTITMGMVATVESATDDEIEMSFEYDTVDAGGDPTVESTLRTIIGTSGTITTDARGVYVDGDIEPAPGMDPTMESTLQQLEQQFANMTVPLPDVAIGQGAIWEVETPVEFNGLETCNTYTYTLDELDGAAYTLGVEIDQQMAPGTVEQNGVEAKLTEGSSSGSGTTHGNLDLPLAVSGTSDLDSATTMEVDQGGDTQEIKTDIGMNLTIAERE
ncbi:DUF6263 family protein [Solicola gregarius]|uniref:DUF6263 family protein n=1 Tax=Solicola gregarius TaxID=2908642 RepID=A0AA46TI21_9ACTN|nr:DUF6263 family protein [Solicola gregarius]UYM05737.1 DUF6263 family protein [Solicola gregarius]